MPLLDPPAPSRRPGGDGSDRRDHARYAASVAFSPDLQGLLDSQGLGHWHSLLLELAAHYDGWLAQYEFDEVHDPDYRPLGEIISLVLNLPLEAHRCDAVFAALLYDCEFLARQARCRKTGEHWDPLLMSYKVWVQGKAEPEPYWGNAQPWPWNTFAVWARDGLARTRR